jgi:hypothetical protein
MPTMIPSMVPAAIHVMVVMASLDDDRFGRGHGRCDNSQRTKRCERERNFLHNKVLLLQAEDEPVADDDVPAASPIIF